MIATTIKPVRNRADFDALKIGDLVEFEGQEVSPVQGPNPVQMYAGRRDVLTATFTARFNGSVRPISTEYGQAVVDSLVQVDRHGYTPEGKIKTQGSHKLFVGNRYWYQGSVDDATFQEKDTKLRRVGL